MIINFFFKILYILLSLLRKRQLYINPGYIEKNKMSV